MSHLGPTDTTNRINQVHTISSDGENDDDIQVIGVLPSTRPSNARNLQQSRETNLDTTILSYRPTLSSVLMGQGREERSNESQRRNEELNRRQLREAERQRLRLARRRALLNRRFSDDVELTEVNFYNHPNLPIIDHTNNPNAGSGQGQNNEITPILIESDVEDDFDAGNFSNDAGAISDTATVGSIDTTSTTRQRMALSADERSIRNARETQAGHLRALTNQRLYGTNEPIILDDDIEEEDEIQFIAEREAPDVQVLSSHNASFQLYTPTGPVFVPTPEVRTGGGRHVNLFGNVSPNRNRVLRSFIRPDNERTRQDELRRVQAQANRRAQEAAAGGTFGGTAELTNLSRNYRTRNSNLSVDSGGSISERTHRRPRRAAAQALTQMLMERPPGLSYLFGSPGMADIRFPTQEVFEGSDFLGLLNSGAFSDMMTDEEVPAHILNLLRRRDEERENRRVSERLKVAEREKEKKAKEAEIDISLRGKFTNEFMNKNDRDVCVLCGVELGVGLPKVCIERDWKDTTDAKTLTETLLKEKFIAPWSGFDRFTQVEIDISKKVYFTPCGHVYCGRCIHNIQRFRGMTLPERKAELNKFKLKAKEATVVSASNIDFADPKFSAPLKCIAEGCTKRFNGKKPFTELFY